MRRLTLVLAVLSLALAAAGTAAAAAPTGMVDAIVILKAQENVSAVRANSRRARIEAVVTALQARAATSQRGLRALLRQRRAEGEVSRVVPLWILNAIEVVATPAVLAELAGRSDVAEVRANDVIAAPEPVPAAAPAEPNVALVNAPALWSLGLRGQGMVVANMDTGVDATHPDLLGRWRGGPNSWFDPNGQHPTTPTDVNGHGTWTMGVMVGGDAGGTSIGVAPDAKWIAVKIFNDQGAATAAGIHLGYQWLLDPDNNPSTADAPNVVNNSWTLSSLGCNLEFQLDLQNLRAVGILPVFAAGNSGPSASTSLSPANNPGALAVGATNNTDAIYSSSSRGPSSCGQPVFPQVVAPGVSIRTSDLFGLYARMSGTSLAAPHVAGALALLLSAFPGLSPDLQEAALEGAAVDLGAPGADNTFGYGRLDALAAYQWLLGGAPPDFTVAATPDSATTPAGGTVSFDVSVGAVSGFSGDVSLGLAGLAGSQATWSFSPPVVAGGSGGSQLSITTVSTLAPGSYPLDIAATGGAITHHAAVTLVVAAPPDFTLVATPASATVPVGGSAQYTVTVVSLNGFAGDVTLTLSGLPAGVTASYSPGLVAGGAGSATLTVAATPTSPLGAFPLTITGTSGSTSHGTAVTFAVTAVPDFAVAVTPGSRTIARGQSTTYSVSVSGTGGFTGAVSLSVAGLPSGAKATFSKTVVVPPGSSLLTIRTTRSTARGTFTLRITGKSGALTHQVTVKLVVNSGSGKLSSRFEQVVDRLSRGLEVW